MTEKITKPVKMLMQAVSVCHIFFFHKEFNISQFESGLGKSEAFYSTLVTSLNIGAVIGASSSIILLKFFPYWHLVLSSVILHILGYVLYALANSGWIMILSKLLSGLYLGAEVTLVHTYIGESITDYQEALMELGEDVKKATRVKHRLFGLHAVGNDIGYILGAGLCFMMMIILTIIIIIYYMIIVVIYTKRYNKSVL